MINNLGKKRGPSSGELGSSKVKLVASWYDVEGQGSVLDLQVLDEISLEIDLNSSNHLLRLSRK